MKHLGIRCWSLLQKTIYTIMKLIYKALNRELPEETFASFMQFVKFGLIGLSNTILFYVVYLPCLMIFRLLRVFTNIDYVVAQVLAFSFSVLWSFFWNNKVVFVLEKDEKRSLWKALIKTYLSYSFTGLFLNSILLIFWVRVCFISETIAPMANLIISVPLNFVINKYWAFRTDRM